MEVKLCARRWMQFLAQSRRVFATLIRLPGDFDLAEDAVHGSFRVAMEQ